jgi:hypothetical protein
MSIAAALASTSLAATTIAEAQSFPSKTVTIVVTAAAGGVTDTVARAIAQRLTEKWGQQIVIENKGGGAHVVGAAAVAKATPDGHTLMLAEAGTYVVNPVLYPKDKLPVCICRKTGRRTANGGARRACLRMSASRPSPRLRWSRSRRPARPPFLVAWC